MKSIKEANIKGKKVLLRADYNVPVDTSNTITDDFRIRASIPTIQYLLKKQAAQVIIMTHFGRPEGKVVDAYRVNTIAQRLSELLKTAVVKTDDCINVDIPLERIVLLENLRFHPEEERDGEDFAKALAKTADIYVNDAFSVCHRSHASVHAITRFLPAYAGLSLINEVENLSKVTYSPKQPFVAIIGGAKDDKIEVIEALLPKLDYLIIGGMLANTFLKANGYDLGHSKFTPELIPKAKEIIQKSGETLLLPRDLVFADRFEAGGKTRTYPVESKDVSGLYGVDIGIETVKSYCRILKKAKTIFWAGPIGVFEIPEFAGSSIRLASYLAGLSSVRIIGGGDSAAAVDLAGFKDMMTFVSTAGGASLEFVAEKRLPGLEVLKFYGQN